MSEDMQFRCPGCSYTGHLYSFDAIGADDGKLFCPQCHLEDEMIECQAARAAKDPEP